MSLHVGYRIRLNGAATNVHSIKTGKPIRTRTFLFLRTVTSCNPGWALDVRCNTAGRQAPRPFIRKQRTPLKFLFWEPQALLCWANYLTWASLAIKQMRMSWAKEMRDGKVRRWTPTPHRFAWDQPPTGPIRLPWHQRLPTSHGFPMRRIWLLMSCGKLLHSKKAEAQSWDHCTESHLGFLCRAPPLLWQVLGGLKIADNLLVAVSSNSH